MANKKYRVLVAAAIGGLALRANDVVSLPDALAKAHREALDGNKEAVAYALSENGNRVIEYKDPSAEAAAALSAEIAGIEARLAAAEEADKPALAEQLAAKQQELAALTE